MKRFKCIILFISIFFSVFAEKDTTYIFQRAEIVNYDLKYIVDSIIVPYVNQAEFNKSRDLLEVNMPYDNQLEIVFKRNELNIKESFNNKNRFMKYLYFSESTPVILNLPQKYIRPTNKSYGLNHLKHSTLTDLIIANDDESSWCFTIENNTITFEKYFSFIHKQFDEWPLLPPDRRIKKLDLGADVPREIKIPSACIIQ